MIQCEIDVCSIDNKIKESSPCYKLMEEVHPDIAHLFLYQVEVPATPFVLKECLVSDDT